MNSHISKFISTMLAAIALVGITGCGAINVMNANRDIYNIGEDTDITKNDRKPGKNDITKPKSEDDWFLQEISKKAGLMALFALTAYRYDLSPEDRDLYSCNYLKKESKPEFGMPHSADKIIRWERWAPKDHENKAEPCYNKYGLFYETYVLRNGKDGHITKAVIAYRGTENRSGQSFLDWSSNFSAVIGFEPRAYALARERLPKLIAQLKNEAPDASLTIYAVGHSLGGGLAQQAGYLSKEIKEVYAFNTSPVTNWAYLRMLGLVDRGYPIIHRIHNGGEWLAGIRSIATASTAARHGRHDIGIQFGEKKIIAGHSMAVLTCGFAEILSKIDNDQFPTDYPREFIETKIIPPKNDLHNKSYLCREENKDEQEEKIILQDWFHKGD